MSKISFLVTYYNQEKYVYDSLKSISEIEIPGDFEVIIGNDGSTDNSLHEIKKWESVFGVKLIVYTADRTGKEEDGVVRASNLRRELLKRSSGDYFCILDGDDFYIDKHFVKEAIKVFEDFNRVSVVMYNYQLKYDDQVKHRITGMYEGFVKPDVYIRQYYSHASACVYRKYSDNDYVKRLYSSVYYDDNDIPILNLIRGGIFYIDRCILSYRQNYYSQWNRLSRSEQGILNVMGADNEVALVPEFSNQIYYRYRRDILYTYFRRNHIEDYINKSLLDKYRRLIRKDWILSDTILSPNYSGENVKRLEEIIEFIRKSDYSEFDRINHNVEKESTT